MKTVKYFDDVNEANIARSFLESEGIEAITLNEHLSGVTPLAFANPSMRPHIVVRDEDYARAAELLGVGIGDPSEVTHCPICDSNKIRYGIANKKGGRKRALKSMFVILSLLGGGALANIRACRYCSDCDAEF